MYKAKSKKRKLIIGLGVVGAVGVCAASGGLAAGPIIGGAAVGGVVGYGVGKANEKMVKKRINETKFDDGRNTNNGMGESENT